MVVLYEHPVSPYAHKVKIALAEKNVAFEARLPDLLASSDADFTAANPRREVPTLVDGDLAVFDSTVILEYIEDRWPTPPLLPATPAERARVRMLEEVGDTYYEAINWGVFEVRFFGRATGALADRLLARAAEQVAGVNSYLERQLGDRKWFNGDAFGWGDLAVIPHVFAASLTGNAPPAGSPLAAWFERAQARPSVAQTFKTATDAMAGFEMIPQLVASGQFKREYRDHRLEWMLRSGGADIVRDGMARGNIRFSAELA
jgi:glutathione S-transferase/RNA polymerase-associated protein